MAATSSPDRSSRALHARLPGPRRGVKSLPAQLIGSEDLWVKDLWAVFDVVNGDGKRVTDETQSLFVCLFAADSQINSFGVWRDDICNDRLTDDFIEPGLVGVGGAVVKGNPLSRGDTVGQNVRRACRERLVSESGESFDIGHDVSVTKLETGRREVFGISNRCRYRTWIVAAEVQRAIGPPLILFQHGCHDVRCIRSLDASSEGDVPSLLRIARRIRRNARCLEVRVEEGVVMAHAPFRVACGYTGAGTVRVRRELLRVTQNLPRR